MNNITSMLNESSVATIDNIEKKTAKNYPVDMYW